jgi:hypothetical protein
VLAAGGRLWTVTRAGGVRSLAPSYRGGGGEAYIALAPVASNGCGFGRGTVYALRLQDGPGVDAITARGRVRRFVRITAPGLLDGITFDQTGGFKHRLLVTIATASMTTVDAIDCHGNVHTVTRSAHRAEGGIVVAPTTFGRFGGDLILPDELGGGIYAVTPRGGSVLVAASRLPHGGDTGVESEAFVGSGPVGNAFLADRRTPGNAHPGDDAVLRLRAGALRAAGVRAGDLLVATEGGARTDVVRCSARGCQVRDIADGPPIAHAEGHIAFR